MAISLLILVNNFAEGIYKIKCKYRQNYKIMKLTESNTKIATAFLNTQNLKII